MSLKNFLSWRELDLLLDAQRLVLLTGANGSGKSSIFVGLTYGLFNTPYRKISVDRVVNDTVGKGCEVAVTTDRGSVVRYRKHREYGNGLRLIGFSEADDGLKAAHVLKTQKRLEWLLGITAPAFIGVSFIDGFASAQFLESTQAGRAELIDRLCGLRVLQTCLQYTRQQFTSLDGQIRALKTEGEATWRRVEELLTREPDRKAMKRRQRHIRQLKPKMIQLKEALDDARKTLEAARLDCRDVEYQVREIEERHGHIQTTLTKLQRLVGQPCPYCLRRFREKDLPAVSIRLVEERDRLRQELDTLQESVKSSGDRVVQERQVVERLEGSWDGLQQQSVSAQQEVVREEAAVTSGVQVLLESLARVRQETRQLERLNQYYRFWVEGFGRDGIRAELLRSVVSVIDDRLHAYAEFFPGLQVGCRLDEGALNIDAGVQGGGRSYGELSNGEKTCVQMVMSIALRDVAKFQYPGAETNILCLDEVLGTLDPQRVHQTMTFLESLLAGSIETIVVISHRSELREYFNSVWEVRKEEGFSRLYT